MFNVVSSYAPQVEYELEEQRFWTEVVVEVEDYVGGGGGGSAVGEMA